MRSLKGFTLVELLLVISLLTISVGATTTIMVSIARSYNKTQVANELEQNANFVTLKIDKELRTASSVSAPSPISLSGTSLVFIDKNGVSVNYSVSNGAVYRGTSVVTNNDSKNGTSVTCPVAGCFTLISSSPTVIRINMIFAQPGNPATSFTGTLSIEKTVVVRGTY